MRQNSNAIGGAKSPIASRMAKLAISSLGSGIARILGGNGKQPQQFEVQPAREVSRAEFRTTKLEPGMAVFWRAGSVETMPASRVVIVPLEAAKGVPVGRVWLFLYPEQGKIRRMFRAEDPQVRSILRMRKSSYYMSDVLWDPALGDQEIERIRHQAASDVVRLVTLASDERGAADCKASPPRSRKVAATSPVAAPAGASEPASAPAVKGYSKAATEASQQTPIETVPVAAPAPAPALKAAAQAPAVHARIATPVVGESREGVIVEMGKIPRQGEFGPYEAFCAKIDVHGVHYPYYGVELEREVIERQARVGDHVRITLMDRMPIGNGRTKNLFKVELLRAGAKAVK